jgi:hypothetical protein
VDIGHANIGSYPFLSEVCDVTDGVGKGKGGKREGEKLRQFFLLNNLEEFRPIYVQIFST